MVSSCSHPGPYGCPSINADGGSTGQSKFTSYLDLYTTSTVHIHAGCPYANTDTLSAYGNSHCSNPYPFQHTDPVQNPYTHHYPHSMANYSAGRSLVAGSLSPAVER